MAVIVALEAPLGDGRIGEDLPRPVKAGIVRLADGGEDIAVRLAGQEGLAIVEKVIGLTELCSSQIVFAW